MWKKLFIVLFIFAVGIFLLTSFMQPAPNIIHSTATASIYKLNPPGYYFKRELSREEMNYLSAWMDKNQCCWSVSFVSYRPKLMVNSELYDFNVNENLVVLNYYDSTLDHWIQVVKKDPGDIYNYLRSRLEKEADE